MLGVATGLERECYIGHRLCGFSTRVGEAVSRWP